MAPNDSRAFVGGSYTPFQRNLDRGIGPADGGKKLTTTIQPVIPFDVGENWKLPTLTIMLVSL
jgi:hypothetical protein